MFWTSLLRALCAMALAAAAYTELLLLRTQELHTSRAVEYHYTPPLIQQYFTATPCLYAYSGYINTR